MQEIKELIVLWIKRINDTENIPENIVAFNFGIFESENEHMIYLSGSIVFDAEDDDWACDEDYNPKEKYLGLTALSKNIDWEEIQNFVKESIEMFANSFSNTFLHKAEYVSTGFDAGELIQISIHKTEV
ncbi:MAG: hypothetical protein KAH48_05570 [Chlorobi bacterium]|nr:hypothetical protein [Chlorobiota bacterium]